MPNSKTTWHVEQQRLTKLRKEVARSLQKPRSNDNAVEKVNANQDQIRIAQVTAANFEAEVIRSPQPVLVEFSATWSQPCHILESVLDEVALACAGKVKVVRINADDNPDLSLWYEIQSVPTLLGFLGGKIRARIVGTASVQAILAKFQTAFFASDPDSNLSTAPDTTSVN